MEWMVQINDWMSQMDALMIEWIELITNEAFVSGQ
jgi:hypothetical protein